MKNIPKWLICLLVLVMTFPVFSTPPEISPSKKLIPDNHIYESKIHTVQLTTAEGRGLPIISLDGGEQLKFSFDELTNNNDYYQFSIQLCNARWEPETTLDYNMYARGMQMDQIENWKFSQNTFIRYVHYEEKIPGNDIQILWAGNYLLKVFRNFNPEDLIITRRFMVIKNQVRVKADVKPATDVKYRFSHQEIDLTVDYGGYSIPNPYQDIQVSILQNNRWDNANTKLKPQFIANNILTYNFEEANLFPGGNEFRLFDTRTLRYFSQNVVKKYFDSVQYHAILNPDEVRAYIQYLMIPDYNGRRMIQNRDGRDENLDADYAKIHFTLKAVDSLKNGPVYLFGEMTDWRIKEEFRMEYFPNLFRYELIYPLKQGIYNYSYVTASEEGLMGDFIYTEGNHMETENDYCILIYHKNQVFGYDELIGKDLINTGHMNGSR